MGEKLWESLVEGPSHRKSSREPISRPFVIPCSHHRKIKVSFLHALYPHKILNITLFGLLYHFSATPKNLSIFQEFPLSCLLSKCSSRCFSNLSLSPEDIIFLQPSGGGEGTSPTHLILREPQRECMSLSPIAASRPSSHHPQNRTKIPARVSYLQSLLPIVSLY